MTKSKLLGEYLRARLLDNFDSPDPAKELLKYSFRHLHRGQGHVLSLDEFKGGLISTFGMTIPRQLIQATFEMFDTEPRTWQLDFDEFCHWLETGERSLNRYGVISATQSLTQLIYRCPPPMFDGIPEGRKPRSNDTSADFKVGGSSPKGMGLSLEQKERAALKAHLVKYRERIHKHVGLTEAQKCVLDHILLEKIKATPKTDLSTTEAFDGLEAFKAFARGGDCVTWNAFKREVSVMLPNLTEESEIREVFSRMDNNGDGVVDLTDFLMWEERMQEGRAKTDFWALEEEQHLEQIRLAKTLVTNPLVPDDYDGSTYFAKLAREKAEKKRADDAEASLEGVGGDCCLGLDTREQHAQAFRDRIISKVKGGSGELLRAFRHFRPAARGRRLFIDYAEFRGSIKQKGLGLGEEDIKSLFGYFDVDTSGEIDITEFRRFFQEDVQLTERQVGGARSDQLLKAKILRQIASRQSDVIQALSCFVSEGDGHGSTGGMDYVTFTSAIAKTGFNLSISETEQMFEKFRLWGEEGAEENALPVGEMSPHAFRDWLLEDNTSISLGDGNVVDKNKNSSFGQVFPSADQAAKRIVLSNLHRKLRAKVRESFKFDHHKLLRSFRGVMRKMGSEISAEEFQAALESFGLGKDKDTVHKLFNYYDWRRKRSIPFQELMEIITKNDGLPRQLTSAECKLRLDKERKASEEATTKLESDIRAGLWKNYLNDVEACHRAIVGSNGGGLIGLVALQDAVRIAGVPIERGSKQALKKILLRNAGAAGGDRCREGWTKADFVNFYRPAACRAAMALAEDRTSVDSHSEADAARAQLICKAIQARTHLLGQARRLMDALKKVDKSGTGKVSRKIFAKALTEEGGLGKVGEMELTRLFVRHKCSVQGGAYVNYPAFVASFSSAVRRAEPATAIAAVAAAAATTTTIGDSTAASSTQAVGPRRRKGGGREPNRSTSNPQLHILSPRPKTVSAATGGGTVCNGEGDGNSIERPRTAELGQRRRETGRAYCTTIAFGSDKNLGCVVRTKQVETLPKYGYIKTFSADSTEMEWRSIMKGLKSSRFLPNLVGLRPEMPKTTPLHRAMKKDVMSNVTKLRTAFKKCENPLRRGVVSVTQFQAVCRKNGVTVDKEDVMFLLKLHRHQPSYGKNSSAPIWVQAPSSAAAAAEMAAKASVAPSASFRYDEFIRTCKGANDVIPKHVR
ncbi:unnamed protein product [Ascophyllum nodosum]